MINKISLKYKDSGVNIDISNKLIKKFKCIAKKTYRPEVISEIGGFSGLCSIPKKYKNPILVSCADGVGTKLRLAIDSNRHNTVGIDLVAMCVNDLITQGAEPLFFLNYYSTSKLVINTALSVISGITEGCVKSGCALVGGETAELPEMFHNKNYELAGFCIGIVEKSGIIDGKKVKDCDALIALGSSGPHSNGYSIIRKILKMYDYDFLTTKLNNRLLIDYLLSPTKIYVKNVLQLIENVNVHAIAHITGGGFWENIPRILPDNTQAIIYESSWNWPPIFNWLQKHGNITRNEMYRIFNCGVGMIIALPMNQTEKAIKIMREKGENAWRIGEIKTSYSRTRVIIK